MQTSGSLKRTNPKQNVLGKHYGYAYYCARQNIDTFQLQNVGYCSHKIFYLCVMENVLFL